MTRIHKRWVLGAIAVGALSPTLAEAAYTSRLQVGNWQGGAWADDATKEFRNCGVSLKFQGGTELTVLLGANFEPAIIVADPRITATPRQRSTAATKFDQNPDRPTPMLALSATMVQFVPPPFPDGYDFVRNARKFGFVAPGLNTSVDVTGLAAVMPRLYECVLAERARMTVPPAKPDETTNADKAEVLATGIVAAEKAAAGPYVVLADKDRPPAFQNALAVWGHVGVAGPDGAANVLAHAHFYPVIAGQTLDRMAAPRKANMRTACNDASFEAGDLPTVPGKQAIGMFVSCRGAYEEVYILARRSGGHVEISLSGPPGRRRTVEAVGAKYRAGFAALP
ncbi:hypothetical protein EDC65_4319 [Stella humosa]|uniref:Uncharacterized protein n=1 Tax=Stella humosa TaxID=94 RepID=A0A3N1KYH6_9PROT|nr:hypothetical protein [Stella humosa]ROP83670.1 hypothetical protein EDC65_4319 [Stella humosa]BBK33057.1 hypothetical protein STHU_36910 [Stella humosa]